MVEESEEAMANLFLNENNEYAIETTSDNCISCKITHLSFFIDTGASISFMPLITAQSFGWQVQPSNIKQVRIADGNHMPVRGSVNIDVDFGHGPTPWCFHVAAVSFPILVKYYFVFHKLLIDPVNNALIPSHLVAKPVRTLQYSGQIIDSLSTLDSNKPSIQSELINAGLSADFLKFKLVFGDVNKEAFASFRVQGTHHYIRTSGAPCTSKVRRLPPLKMQALNEYINEMLDQGVISRSSSPWSSPIQMVMKKDGSWRICGDYRALNQATQRDQYPLPNILDVQNCLHGKTVFSKVDLFKGFWQVPMAPEDAQKTAVITPLGLFEFNRMPFGLRNASNTFQRVMDAIF